MFFMRRIVITSGKGGVGKTTVTATLGRDLSFAGFRVALVDADVGLNNLDVVTGVERRVVYDLCDVLAGKCRVFQALVQDSESAMRILPSSRGSDRVTAQAFAQVVRSLSGFDFVLIDCPAGIEHGFHRAVSAAEEALVVVTPSASAIRDADKVVALLRSYPLKDISLVVNRVRPDLVRKGDALSAAEISGLMRVPVVGVIPDDDAVGVYQQFGGRADSTYSDRAFKVLATNIAEGRKDLVDVSFKRRSRRGIRRI